MLVLLALLLQAPQRPNVCYEVFVRSFYDSNGDGIGDLRGLTQKLDYIAGLGVDCVWLMPVAESPSYHGYDVTDYYKVEPDYGTNDDFKAFVAAAHQRHIQVLVDMVLNHTSSQHPWFQEALKDTAGPHRAWYRWSKNPGNNWHHSSVRDEYYFGLFWSGMPDLNYETPAVLEEMKRVAYFWLTDMGVDGFRLDAVRHLVERGDTVSNTPETHAVLRDYGAYVRSVAPSSYTIGEVWDSTGAILSYYPDQLDAYFAFPVSEALMQAVKTGKAGSLLTEVTRFQSTLPSYRWAPFQRNHDQTRTLTALGNDVAGAKLAATILLTLPGVPFVYYGEEIGMTGDKPDERLRTPMQWELAPAAGFTRGKPWEALQPDSFTANVTVENRDGTSLLNLYRGLLRMRSRNSALRNGTLEAVETGNESVLAYIRRDSARVMLVVANLGNSPIRQIALPGGARSLDARRAYIYELRKEEPAPPAPPPPSVPRASTVTAEDVGHEHPVSIQQMLAGRISGVIVNGTPDGGITVRMTGPTSFYSGQRPLIIVDGAVIEAGPNGSLNWLNPRDIESITALKDPSQTAIYGVRGSNGVIVIKTKGSH